MTPDRLREAAEALRFNAGMLLDAYAVRGEWPSPITDDGARMAKVDHDRWLGLASELDEAATNDEEIERMVKETARPQTPEELRPSGEMFARLSRRLIARAHETTVKSDAVQKLHTDL